MSFKSECTVAGRATVGSATISERRHQRGDDQQSIDRPFCTRIHLSGRRLCGIRRSNLRGTARSVLTGVQQFVAARDRMDGLHTEPFERRGGLAKPPHPGVPPVVVDCAAWGPGRGGDFYFGDDYLYGGSIDCCDRLWARSTA